jgi:hypothetical protein
LTPRAGVVGLPRSSRPAYATKELTGRARGQGASCPDLERGLLLLSSNFQQTRPASRRCVIGRVFSNPTAAGTGKPTCRPRATFFLPAACIAWPVDAKPKARARWVHSCASQRAATFPQKRSQPSGIRLSRPAEDGREKPALHHAGRAFSRTDDEPDR